MNDADVNCDERSTDRFEVADFDHLADLAAKDLAAFVERNPRHATLPNRVLLVALCQGAALHHVDGVNGVKDFDVWTFFAGEASSPNYPVRRIGRTTFEGSRFGGSTCRVDLLGRTLAADTGTDGVEAVRDYLAQASTGTAWHLAHKPVVALWPSNRRGQVIWEGAAGPNPAR